MAMYMFVLLCCLFSGYQILAASIGKPSEKNGDYILDLGNQHNHSLLRLVGKVYKNFEHNMSKVILNSRAELFLKQICEANECDPWSEWSECPAEEGHFGWVIRTRECGRNNTHCTYETDLARTEEETRLCVGGDGDDSESSEDEAEAELEQFPVRRRHANPKIFKAIGRYPI